MKKQTQIFSLLLALLLAFSVTAAAAEALTVTAAYGGAALEGATLPGSAEITLMFSNNVTDETVLANNVGKIKVKDDAGAVAAASVAAGADNRTLTVTLGGLAKGGYTLELGKEIKAKNGVTLGEKAIFSFTVKGSGSGDGTGGGNNPLEVESVKVGDMDLASAELAGSEMIVIRFTRGMTENAEANAKLISVLDKDRKAADITVFMPGNRDEGVKNVVKVQLNGLAGGEYTLVLDKDIRANNGNALGNTITYGFKVKAAEEPEKAPTVLDRIMAFAEKYLAPVMNVLRPVINAIERIVLFVRQHLAILGPKAS